VALHAESVAALELAVQRQPRARRVLVDQPRLLKERRLHHPGGIGHGRLHQRAHAPPAHGPGRDAAHLHDDGGRLAGHQLADRPRLAVVARQMLEQVADREQPKRLGRGLSLCALDLQRAGENRRPRVADRSLRQLGIIQ
jgi:hypothetical protein